MKNLNQKISFNISGSTYYVTQLEAMRILSVEARTARRWANGTRPVPRERALLLAILTGQLIPLPGWDEFSFVLKRGPAPNRTPFAALHAPNGKHYTPGDFYPLSTPRPPGRPRPHF